MCARCSFLTHLLCAVFHRELAHYQATSMRLWIYLCYKDKHANTTQNTNLLKWTMLQRCVEILFLNVCSNIWKWWVCVLFTILCVGMLHTCNQSQQMKWYSTTDIYLFSCIHIRLLARACVCMCAVKCHNKHFVCIFDCFAYGLIFRQMIIVMYRGTMYMCVSVEPTKHKRARKWRENTRANTTFDRFCSFVNSHLTFDSFRFELNCMIVASSAIFLWHLRYW